jgi:aminocarboxymuconate-semialdehyde decarboxylase
MKVDIFNHFFPRRFFEEFINTPSGPKDIGRRVREAATIVDLDARFRVMDEFGEYCQIISLPMPSLESLAGPDKSPHLARVANDGMAELCARHPDRFPSFVASLPMNNIEESQKEADRAVKQLGARGVQVFTNVAGKPLDADDVLPLFEELARRDVVIWMHPSRGANFPDYLSEDKSKYEIWWTFGWPYETSAAMARLVFSGIFDRHPGLKIITHHMGGMIPYFSGKIGLGFRQIFFGTPDRNPVAEECGLKRPPADYFHMLYADTALNGEAAPTRCGHAFFGTAHCLFATDAPFDAEQGRGLIAKTIRAVEALEISAAERAQILAGNARALLRLN